MTIQDLERPTTLPDPETPPDQWTRCACGKIASPTEEEAARKAAYKNRTKGRAAPTRYYPCREGSWHWAEKYVTVRDCGCGHRSYYDHRAASKAAERRNRHPRTDGLDARAFTCAHGGFHVVLYPVGEHLHQCPCGAVAYRTIELSDILLDFLDSTNRPGTPHYDAYRCDHHTIHVTREDRLPAGAHIITEDEA